jgi:hypothetical protein
MKTINGQIESYNNSNRSEYKTIGTKVKIIEIPIMNQRLKIYGYQTIGELIHDFISSKFSPIHDDEQLKQSIAHSLKGCDRF